jgi:glycosyltransferase involved in cell wall biosynthesis
LTGARPRACLVVSSPLTIRAFLAPQIRALATQLDVSLVANAAAGAFAELPARFFPVAIERRIAPLADLRALIALHALFRRERFSVVHSVTPKAGLLAMLAARLAGVPARVHMFTGQVWATRTGAARALLRSIDGLIAACATRVLVDSPGQREFLVANGVVSAQKSAVLANGSICGVDGERFRPDAAARAGVREALGVPHDAVLFLYVGRLNRDKGLLDLAAAFNGTAERFSEARLLFVGPDEEALRAPLERVLERWASRVYWVGETNRPQEYMAAADVFCLPSYREGFGQSTLEAAACGLPIVASRIYGIVDAVRDGESGLLHPAADVPALRACMERLAREPELRRRLGEAGRRRALREFSAAQVTQALLALYAGLAGTGDNPPDAQA